MTDKEKEQKALEIYQQLINTLEDVSEKAEIINIVKHPVSGKMFLPEYGRDVLLSHGTKG